MGTEGRVASAKEIGKDDRRSVGWVLEEEGSEALEGWSSGGSEGPAIAVLEGCG